MDIFELKDNQITIRTEALTIPEFKKIWDADRSKHKDAAFKEFAYIYHSTNYNSPYSNFPEDKKEESIIHDIINDKKWKLSKETREAKEKYISITQTSKQRLLESAKYKIDEIAKYLKDTPLDENSSKSILEIFKSISTTIKNFDEIENAVKKENEQNSTRRRGGTTTSIFEE